MEKPEKKLIDTLKIICGIKNKYNKYGFSEDMLYLRNEEIQKIIAKDIEKKYKYFASKFYEEFEKNQGYTEELYEFEQKILKYDAKHVFYFLTNLSKIWFSENAINFFKINFTVYGKRLAEFNDPLISSLFVLKFIKLDCNKNCYRCPFDDHLNIIANKGSTMLNAYVVEHLGDKYAPQNKQMIVESNDLDWNFYMANLSKKYPKLIAVKPHAKVILNSNKLRARSMKRYVRNIISAQRTLNELAKEL